MEADKDDGDLTEMLNEVRVLLSGSQLLTAFLISVPFMSGFRQIIQSEKWVFMATFISSLASLILFAAPAVQHRMLRPLRNRSAFKDMATRQILAGVILMALALVLAASLVVSEVFGHGLGIGVSVGIGALIVSLWYWLPARQRKKLCSGPES